MSESLADIEAKVLAGGRVDFEEAVFLDETADLFTLGRMANAIRERKNGNLAFFNTNIHLNPTNVCVYRCKFCAFRSDLKNPKGYVFEDAAIQDRAREAHENGATEIHIVGGLHHKKPFEWYVDVIRLVHEAAPELHIKGWTGVEINWFARLTKQPYEWILKELQAAGLGSLPGGGAEIFDESVRSQLCEHKADSDKWLEIHRTAHELGIRSNATMLYGHVEQARHRVDHLMRLRALQDDTGGFQTFIPLAFHPDNTELSLIPKPGGLTDLRTMAVARIVLDNFDHMKAYWIMLGEKIAQTALSFGADDLDGTVVHETIYHEAGATTPEGLTPGQIQAMIREAGRDPVERDTLYREVVRDPAQPKRFTIGEPIRATAVIA